MIYYIFIIIYIQLYTYINYIYIYKCIYLYNIYIIHKIQETSHNINVKIKFKTYFQLKFISSVNPLYYLAMEI